MVTRVTTVPLDEILSATPEGKIAMFEVTMISVRQSDYLFDMPVYVHRNKVWDFMSDTEQGSLEDIGLHFLRYVDR